MSHPVHWLVDSPHALLAIGSDGAVRPRRWRAVNDFAFFELTLQVSRNKIPTPHEQSVFARKGRQEAKGGAAHGCAMCLIKIDAWLLGTPLHAEPSLHTPAALTFEDPNELHESSSRSFPLKNTSIQESEGPVLFVVLQLGGFCLSPAVWVILHGLVVVARVVARGGVNRDFVRLGGEGLPEGRRKAVSYTHLTLPTTPYV